ncbi:MAG TPA: AMP-binding protein [Planctomycetota bacterium]|jgi:long-chain acyl-CoA synthetase
MNNAGPLSIKKCFAGKGVLLTGATGFLAKAVAEKLLRDLPDIGQIYLLIRSRVKPDGSRIEASERLHGEILRNSAFGRLREQLGEDFESFCASKITCVPGDLTAPHLGLDDKAFADLSKKVHVVVNSAATVVFDERLDLALDLNTMGPQRLLEFARAAGAVYVHISTAYVSGMRTGLVPEKLLDPMKAIDAQLPPGVPRPQKFDVNEELASLNQMVRNITADCEKLLRQKGIVPESEEGTAQLRTALVSAGMRRSQSLGWNDTYTYTKFLGEQLIKMNHGPVPTVIVRPSIIESSLAEPEPGWLDGLRMADPIIIGFGKGRLQDFPANQNITLDIIPADLVVNTVLAATAYIVRLGQEAVGRASLPADIPVAGTEARPTEAPFDLFVIGSSSENPLLFRALYEHVRAYFQKHPMTDRSGKTVAVATWRFPSVERYRSQMRNRYLRPIKAANFLLAAPLPIPGGRRMRMRLRTLNTTLEQLLYYVDIYGPYVNLQCRFETNHTRELQELVAPEERPAFSFDPRRIHWRNYIQDIHIPGLKRNILRMDVVPRTGAGEGHLLDEEGAAAQKRRGAPVGVRGVPQTIVDLCARGAERFGNKPFLEMRRTEGPSVSLSYADFFEKSGALARRLIARLGLHPGDRVAIIGENCPEWSLAYMSVSRACCAAVPLDRVMPPAEAARLIKLVEAKALIISPALHKTFREELADRNALPPCLNMLDLQPLSGEAWPYPEASIGDRPLKDPSAETLASILFTSGTTWDPKGVMLSHANLVADALSVAEVLEPMESDRFLSLLPLQHAFEFTCDFLIPMYGGSTIYHVENPRKDALPTMKSAQITVVLGVPRLFKMFMDGIRAQLAERGLTTRLSVSVGHTVAGALELAGSTQARKKIFKAVHEGFGGKLRLFVSGGAALDPEIYHFFEGFGIPIAEGYGLTETSPVLTVNPLGASKAGSVGPAVPGTEIRIAAPDEHGVGEVLARGPTIMHGYWRNPAATEKTFESGWFKTGDLGRVDPDGYLQITGRLKDVIVTSAGKNVYPDEVEAALREIPGVKELCVVGLPARSGMGEEVAAIVVPKPDGNRDAIQTAIDKVCRSLSSHQRVARLEFQSDDLPRTSTLKVQRGKVRQRYISGGGPERHKTSSQTPAKSANSGVPAEIAQAIADVSEARVQPGDITLDAKLEMDLGFDSIGRSQLLTTLEMLLEISIPKGVEGKLFTVRDLLHVVDSARKNGKAGALVKTGASKQELLHSSLQSSVSKSLLQGAFSTTASVFMNTWLRIDCHGLENIPRSGPYILTANHCSHLDSVAIREALGRRAADLYVMGAKDYFFDTRLKSWFFTTFLNALPFDRDENVSESIAACKIVLERGRAILLYPEGTRSVSGELQAFKPGIGVLGLELDVPVIPVFLKGTFQSLPKGNSLPRPARITVRIGLPVNFDALKKEKGAGPQGELYRRAAAHLRSQIEALGNS